MIAVDLWAPQAPRPDIIGAETYEHFMHEKSYARFSEVMKQNYPGRVDILRMKTHDASRFIKDESLDFVFVDADHSYEGCKQDIEDWLPKIRRGGIICGHDLHWPTVEKAVSEKFKEYVAYPDNVWVVQI